MQAWAWFEPEALLAQARRVDAQHAAGLALGPLAGLPVGVKDIIDTAGVPTELGTPLHAGRGPIDAEAAVQTHRLIMEAEIAASFADEYARGRDVLSDSLRSQIERGHATTAADHRAAVAQVPWLRAALDTLFDRFDAIVTPARWAPRRPAPKRPATR